MFAKKERPGPSVQMDGLSVVPRELVQPVPQPDEGWDAQLTKQVGAVVEERALAGQDASRPPDVARHEEPLRHTIDGQHGAFLRRELRSPSAQKHERTLGSPRARRQRIWKMETPDPHGSGQSPIDDPRSLEGTDLEQPEAPCRIEGELHVDPDAALPRELVVEPVHESRESFSLRDGDEVSTGEIVLRDELGRPRGHGRCAELLPRRPSGARRAPARVPSSRAAGRPRGPD